MQAEITLAQLLGPAIADRDLQFLLPAQLDDSGAMSRSQRRPRLSSVCFCGMMKRTKRIQRLQTTNSSRAASSIVALDLAQKPLKPHLF